MTPTSTSVLLLAPATQESPEAPRHAPWREGSPWSWPTPLDNPRRQHLLAFVHANPGAGLREAARATGIPPSSTAHHLGILKRKALLVEARVGARRLYFTRAPHRPEATAALRRLPALDTLRAWLKENPATPQKEILDRVQTELGWPRSTTQYRLGLLVDAGLVQATPQGRTRTYALRNP
ncbi:MAG: hypothetical protein QOI63_963 [Thermoplasmata archaeon]|nr:hypothetical protein [Thermoplasmata archaeon]